MARKAHDLFSLLQSRGGRGGRSGRRTSGGLLSGFTSILAGILPAGGGRNRDVTRSRGRGTTLNGPAIAAVVFASLLIGYLLGDAFPWRQRPSSELNAGVHSERQAQVPGPLNNGGEMSAAEECKKLAAKALLVCVAGSDDRQRVSAVSRYLRSQGLDKARCLQKWLKTGESYWLSVVYFEGEKDAGQVVQRLQEVQFPADLVAQVEPCKNRKEGWPVVIDVE